MRNAGRMAVLSLLPVALACSSPQPPATPQDHAALDTLNARLVEAYRSHDPEVYAGLFTDTAVFEWPAFDTVRGRAGLAAMARGNWASLNDMDLRLTVSSRRVAEDHATEFGAFEQSWSDSAGVRMTEFGRYASLLTRQEDGGWLMERFFGFSDSTRTAARP